MLEFKTIALNNPDTALTFIGPSATEKTKWCGHVPEP